MRRRCGRAATRGSGERSRARSRGPGPGREPEAQRCRNPNQDPNRRFGSWS